MRTILTVLAGVVGGIVLLVIAAAIFFAGTVGSAVRAQNAQTFCESLVNGRSLMKEPYLPYRFAESSRSGARAVWHFRQGIQHDAVALNHLQRQTKRCNIEIIIEKAPA